MASQATNLQSNNNELVKCIEDLREKRAEIHRIITREEEDKVKIQKELAVLTERLQRINESLVRKTQARLEYDKTIQETEAAYVKILESTQTLLHVLKRERVHLEKKGAGEALAAAGLLSVYEDLEKFNLEAGGGAREKKKNPISAPLQPQPPRELSDNPPVKLTSMH